MHVSTARKLISSYYDELGDGKWSKKVKAMMPKQVMAIFYNMKARGLFDSKNRPVKPRRQMDEEVIYEQLDIYDCFPFVDPIVPNEDVKFDDALRATLEKLEIEHPEATFDDFERVFKSCCEGAKE